MPVPPEVTLTPNGTPCGRQYRFNNTHFEGIGMNVNLHMPDLELACRNTVSSLFTRDRLFDGDPTCHFHA